MHDQPAPGGHADRDAPSSASLADIMRAVSWEASDLGQLACGLQAVLSLLGQALGPEGRAVEALQTLDLFTQRLQNMAAFLDALAPTLPSAWRGDAAKAAQAIALSDLARRLGRPGSIASTADPDTPGAVEFFETDTP